MNNSMSETTIQEFVEDDSSATNDQSLVMDQECAPMLEKYLAQLIELVPDLKEIDREEKVRRILFSSNSPDESDANTSTSALDGFENLDLNNAAKSISDLQILQSVLDYIRDLKSKIGYVESC